VIGGTTARATTRNRLPPAGLPPPDLVSNKSPATNDGLASIKPPSAVNPGLDHGVLPGSAA
jgi:hypothetical protein